MLELVYLWVENYKNIQKQGFNFSPRFECKFHDEYDDDGKLKDNCELVICDKKKKECKDNDYIENFFGENINVTAIVGKNGSGKSAILESIYFNSKKLLDKNIIIIKKNTKFIIYTKFKINNIMNNTKVPLIIEKEKLIDIPYMNISHFHNEDINLTDINHISVYRNRMYHYEVEGWDENDITDRYKNFKTELNYFFLSYKNMYKDFEDFFHIEKTKYFSINLFKNDNIREFAFDILLDAKKIFYLILSDKVPEDFDNSNYDFDINIWNDFLDNYNKGLKKEIDELIDTSSVENGILIVDVNNKFLTSLLNLATFKKMEYLELIRLNKDKERIDLSSGEQIILMYLYAIQFQKGIFLIDEIDLYLHPEWQKFFLSFIFKNTDIKHLVITTHSPFILSDIPKQNIIFLDKDKDENGKCKVVDGLKEKKQTFGANIHTLLSDSFFMEDGLMGAFAKGKIDEVIDYLNGKDTKIKDDDEAQKLVNIIGEPIVKNQLQRMLDSKRLSKIDAINEKIKNMSYELEILKEHQTKIVQDELRNRGKKQYKQRLKDD